MLKKTVKEKIYLLDLLFTEFLSKSDFSRKPELNPIMNEAKSVKAFHDEGGVSGRLMPIYHFNAIGMSSLIPPNGTVLDLGSGSCQYLIHLANLRKDIKIIGVELSDKMIETAFKSIKKYGLENRINLMKCDISNFSELINSKIDVISSLYSFHHLKSLDEVVTCLKEISKLKKIHKCSIWIFDHARPRLKKSAYLFPEIFLPESPVEIQKDAINSLIASFSFEELRSHIDSSFDGDEIIHVLSKIMKLYQLHVVFNGEKFNIDNDNDFASFMTEMPKKRLNDFKLFKWMFSDLFTYYRAIKN